jgi:hypothetical protein
VRSSQSPNSIFDLSGPARAALTELNLVRTRVLIEQIEAIVRPMAFSPSAFRERSKGSAIRSTACASTAPLHFFA